MRLRLTHVLVLMALVLAAGVLSVQGLEATVGATSVPGVVALDVPGLSVGALNQLGRRRGGAVGFAVRASDDPCAPFDRAFAHRAARGGTATLLTATSPLPDRQAQRAGWGVVVAPDEASAPDAGGLADPVAAAGRLAAFVADSHGTRPFVAGLMTGPMQAERVAPLLDALLDAAARLPGFRRTSVVLLGERLPDGERRAAIRFDVGRWKGHARPALADLLEDIP